MVGRLQTAGLQKHFFIERFSGVSVKHSLSVFCVQVCLSFSHWSRWCPTIITWTNCHSEVLKGLWDFTWHCFMNIFWVPPQLNWYRCSSVWREQMGTSVELMVFDFNHSSLSDPGMWSHKKKILQMVIWWSTALTLTRFTACWAFFQIGCRNSTELHNSFVMKITQGIWPMDTVILVQ